MTAKLESSNSWLGTFYRSSTVICVTLSLGACTGMSAPYPSRPAKGPSKIVLIPITAKVVEDIKAKLPPPPPRESLPPPQPGAYRYLIKPGDVLDVSLSPIVTFNTVNSGNLIGEAGQGHVVHYDGTIYLPYAGTVTVAGLTIRDAQTRVVEALSRFLKTPEVLVSVREFRSQRALLTGQVTKPGPLPITDVPLTLFEALAASGALIENRGVRDPANLTQGTNSAQPQSPDLSRIYLQRGGKEFIVNALELAASWDKATDVVLLDGDVIRVPALNRGKVFLMGEIQRPSLVEIDAGQTNLAEVLLFAGGFDQLSAKASRVYLIRGDLRKPTVYQLNASSPDSILLAEEFPVQPKDVVFVSTAGIARWNRFLQQLLPAINGVISTAVISSTIDNNNNN